MKPQIDDLTFSVVRSSRRTADIVVERDARVVVRAPESVSAEAIDDAVRANAAWIHRTIAEWEELNAARRRRAFVQGSSFLYRGGWLLRRSGLGATDHSGRATAALHGTLACPWTSGDDWLRDDGGHTCDRTDLCRGLGGV